jgi:hypothetical protein
MDRRELMKAIAIATGVTIAGAAGPQAAPDHASNIPAAAAHAEPQGYAASGNPKAAGGPANPGVGNPFNAY